MPRGGNLRSVRHQLFATRGASSTRPNPAATSSTRAKGIRAVPPVDARYAHQVPASALEDLVRAWQLTRVLLQSRLGFTKRPSRTATHILRATHLDSPIPHEPRSIWWRCEPTATFADCKAAADKLLAKLPPHEPYSTDSFKRDHDKLLWDPRYGKRRYGMIKFKPATCIGDVYAEGDEILCMQHLHKQWARTCNGLSESRLDRIDAARALAGAEAREDIVKQATREHVSKEDKVRAEGQFASWKAPKPIGAFHRSAGKASTGHRSGTGSGTRSGTARSGSSTNKSGGGGGASKLDRTMTATSKSLAATTSTRRLVGSGVALTNRN